jgi:hypothetical protein
MGETGLYKFGAERVLQTLALTATGDGLDVIGNNYNVFRKAAVPAELEATIDAPGLGTGTIAAGTKFVGDSNNELYQTTTSVGQVAGVATLSLQAETPGVIGNLENGETLTIVTQISGVGTVATVTDTLVTGVDRESDDAYRRRVLNELRTVGGGGNSADYRTWSEQVEGVVRAFPYSGSPIGDVSGFEDGDMEAPNTDAWTAGNSATLTKETTPSPHGGLRFLRITYGGVSAPYAAQSPLILDERYRVNGFARGDGSNAPSLQNAFGIILWEGTSSTTWQEFDVKFVAVSPAIVLYSDVTSSGYVDFDDIVIEHAPLPGDRTVYIESNTPPDGIASAALLEAVRESITTDPDTGITRVPLGMIDGTLWVESIYRLGLYLEIEGLDVSQDILAETKDDIEAAMITYLRSIAPFVDGLDPVSERNDTVTNTSLSKVLDDVLERVGGSAIGVKFGTVPSVFTTNKLVVSFGKLLKLEDIEYV